MYLQYTENKCYIFRDWELESAVSSSAGSCERNEDMAGWVVLEMSDSELLDFFSFVWGSCCSSRHSRSLLREDWTGFAAPLMFLLLVDDSFWLEDPSFAFLFSLCSLTPFLWWEECLLPGMSFFWELFFLHLAPEQWQASSFCSSSAMIWAIREWSWLMGDAGADISWCGESLVSRSKMLMLDLALWGEWFKSWWRVPFCLPFWRFEVWVLLGCWRFNEDDTFEAVITSSLLVWTWFNLLMISLLFDDSADETSLTTGGFGDGVFDALPLFKVLSWLLMPFWIMYSSKFWLGLAFVCVSCCARILDALSLNCGLNPLRLKSPDCRCSALEAPLLLTSQSALGNLELTMSSWGLGDLDTERSRPLGWPNRDCSDTEPLCELLRVVLLVFNAAPRLEIGGLCASGWGVPFVAPFCLVCSNTWACRAVAMRMFAARAKMSRLLESTVLLAGCEVLITAELVEWVVRSIPEGDELLTLRSTPRDGDLVTGLPEFWLGLCLDGDRVALSRSLTGLPDWGDNVLPLLITLVATLPESDSSK